MGCTSSTSSMYSTHPQNPRHSPKKQSLADRLAAESKHIDLSDQSHCDLFVDYVIVNQPPTSSVSDDFAPQQEVHYDIVLQDTVEGSVPWD